MIIDFVLNSKPHVGSKDAVKSITDMRKSLFCNNMFTSGIQLRRKAKAMLNLDSIT